MCAVFVAFFAPLGWHRTVTITEKDVMAEQPPEGIALNAFLLRYKSPLAPDAEYVVSLKHWRLIVAISAIESQFCKYQVDYNCWGIGGDNHYRHYGSFKEAAKDADDLIEAWQKRGRWLTVEDMNGSYVVPKNENWVRVVNKVLKELPQ